MNERSPEPRNNPHALRTLILLLAVLAIIAGLVATRLVSAGSIHQGQEMVRAVSAVYRAGAGALSQSADLPPEAETALASVPGGFEVQGWSETSILDAPTIRVALRRTQSDERHILCVWRKTDQFSSVRSTSRDVDGVRVDLWSDANHVYALARALP